MFYKERPVIAYSWPALFFALASLILSVLGLDLCNAIWTFPPAFLSFIGFLLFGTYGVYANKQIENKREMIRLHYLSYPFVNNDDNS